MVQTKIFKIHGSQTLTLPKNVALPERIKLVDIVAVGNRRIISPAGTAWDEWFENGPIPASCMSDRSQPNTQVRKPLKT